MGYSEMRINTCLLWIACMIGIVWWVSAGAVEERAAIETVEIRPGRARDVIALRCGSPPSSRRRRTITVTVLGEG